MNQLDRYLEIIPLPVLAFIGLIGILGVIVIPARLRLPLSLAALPVWLALGLMPQLGPIQAVAKATGFLAFAIVGVSSVLEPGYKRRLPFVLWLYPICGAMTLPFALGSGQDSAVLTLVLNTQWLLLTVSAILLARAVVDDRMLRSVLLALALGSGIAVLIAFSALLLSPGRAFIPGLGRLAPWGANPNHIGPVALLAVPLLLYFGLRDGAPFRRMTAFGVAGIGTLVALLTASRSVIFPIGLLCGLLLWEFRRRPIAIVAGVVALAASVWFGRGFIGEASVQRLGTIQSGRFQIFQDYLAAIGERPLFGRLFRDAAEGLPGGTHAHNAFLDMLYEHGFLVGGPLLLLLALTVACTVRVWLNRRYLGTDPLLASLLCGFMAVVYLHGLTTPMIYHGTHTWAFFHVLLSALMVTWGFRPREALHMAEEPWEQEYADYDDAYGAFDEGRPGVLHE